MPRTQPPLPSRAQLIGARQIAGNPGQFLHEPDFEALISTAWWALKADQMERLAARRAAEVIRAAFPEDAA